MLVEREFRVNFGHDPDPETQREVGLTGDDRTTLFREGDITVLVEE